MSNELSRESIGKGVNFSFIKDSKFKRNRLSVNFVMPLSKETAANNAIVPLILRKGYRDCPDFTSLNSKLAELYGASLDADVSKYGSWQILEVSIDGLDNRYALEKEDVTGMCAELLACIVLDPKLDAKGFFHEDDLELERQFLLDTIESEINDKRTYALARCMQTMCNDEPVAVRKYGDIDTAKAITASKATDAYNNMIKTAQVEILFVGSGDCESTREIFADRFANIEREPLEIKQAVLRTKASKVQEETEKMELSQAKLVLGLRTGEMKYPRDICARRVFSALFGGTPFSKLFLNVREKLSLCYYCASRFDISTGLLFVDSGVEFVNKQKAQDEILVQLKAMQNGEFTAEDLANTKLLMKNSINTTGDSLSSLEGWYLSQILRNQNITPEEDAMQIEEITSEEIIAVANSVTLDTIYYLTGNKEAAQ